MEMFISSKTFKQLTQLMTNIFSHGVQTDQVEISMELAKQLHSYKYYTRTMVDSMEECNCLASSMEISTWSV
jgi:hypothetical protein